MPDEVDHIDSFLVSLFALDLADLPRGEFSEVILVGRGLKELPLKRCADGKGMRMSGSSNTNQCQACQVRFWPP